MLNASVRFSPSNIAALKKALRSGYPHIRSSHLDEAIAASFGFNSYAAMRPVLLDVSTYARLVVNTNHLLLLLRLEELGYRDIAPEELRRLIWRIEFPQAWHDGEIEKAIQERRRPPAANA
ncbi:hypothetical protein ELI13_37315 [Rhizobium ruizarguesonis]|uniref:Uncharacterized protein n=1 Tax=Rhizobium ruizarguesonis TaxID=2081791 RepID=A0ABY1WXE5_9HYPH|nr:hypothetical protein [Rhizobium ruizarguesonis]TAU14423.1 hypothetical protein ELI48_35095 [Rhizobium ruizarguesonis]TAU56959.1 hypothetical protein ELI45_38540 [Rhizobium ruizarguesonis]TAU60893.1 hypothetical protein ELI46_34415 [Rhizobium ruizarguesonis]TAV08995.1 hypothetical protein ELI34_27095 [Rhizobium ruizarguesonis]TAV20934.1 hypothetical protein ELI36_33170 [Rhizobium ruizarguesonis]